MWIPEILRRHQIMGKNRKEPRKCGHFHTSKEVIIPELTGIQYMDALVLDSDWEIYSDRYVNNSLWGQITPKKHEYDRTK
jgi:hypothetical protein